MLGHLPVPGTWPIYLCLLPWTHILGLQQAPWFMLGEVTSALRGGTRRVISLKRCLESDRLSSTTDELDDSGWVRSSHL